jgi:CRISPR system Cascade subunit CasE
MSAYFSEASFRPATPVDFRELARLGSDVDVQHKTLWGLFPSPAGMARPFLYRQRIDDETRHDDCARFWLVSSAMPEAPDARWRIRSKRYSPVFHTGQRLRFELRIAPSVTRVDPRQAIKPGKRVPRSTRFDPVAVAVAALPAQERATERQRWVDGKLASWLQGKAARCGFAWRDPDSVMVVRYEAASQERSRRENLRFSIADFRGELEVTDVAAFTQAALHGVGHQRSFGCGLLLLRPTHRDNSD